ncbi:MAG: glycosyltransferase family 4 protein [Planctomycetota bacterium]
MKVAVLSPIAWRTPPRHYGPWEFFVHLLTEGLVARGIDVTLFATLDSLTSGRLAGVCPGPYEEDPEMDVKVWECLHISELFERAGEFDLIHNSFDFLPLTYSRLVETPVVTTIHGFSSPKIIPVYKKYNDRAHYVSISDADRAPGLDYIATVHHGLPIGEFIYSPEPMDYLLFFGRLSHEKGVVEAIDLAERVNMPLKIAGIVQEQDYFAELVEPRLDPGRIDFLGPADHDRRNELLGGAKALIHLINFKEPFGFTMIEAMACGTPVIARGLGSIPEVVDHGKTGFIVDSVEEAGNRMSDTIALSRADIRKIAEKRWTVERMVEDYIRVYEAVLGVGNQG